MNVSDSDVVVHGLTVCGNEINRYLEASLAHNSRYLTSLFIYDDQSTDGSAKLASEYGHVERRSNEVSTFMEDEGRFRQAAWDAWEKTIQPKLGDWILAFDVDEFWYGPDLDSLVGNYTGGIIHRPEMYSFTKPLHRVDGLWDQIRNVRFFPYAHPGKFPDRDMACGSAPLYTEGTKVELDGNLLHYGYADPADRVERLNRYINRSGHNKRHIRSIAGMPQLEELEPTWGRMPSVWRGIC